MRTLRMLAIAGISCCWAAASTAAAYLPAAHSPAGVATASAPAPEGGCGPIVLSQSSAQNIVPDNSVSCNADGTVHVENSYYRAYDLAAFPTGFSICAVEVGIQSAAGAGGSQPVTFNIYANTGGAFPSGSSMLLMSRTVLVSDQAGTVLSVPVSAGVPSGSQMVVEVLTPDGQAAGNSFFIGSNAAGESAPSFLRAPSCGVVAPATTVASGFPGMHIVLNARGSAGSGEPVVAANPVIADFGQVELGFTAVRAVSLSNPGTAPLTVMSVATPPIPFEVLNDACSGRVLAPSESCELRYEFTPLQIEPVSTSLAVTSNASPLSIDLRGAGLLPYPLPGPGIVVLSLLVALMVVVAARHRHRMRPAHGSAR
jgi:hypothetical protein